MPEWMHHNPDLFRLWLRNLNTNEKREFAQKMGVSLRTVQRWAVSPMEGKQYRNFIPKRFQSKPIKDVPDNIRQRENTARMREKGISRQNPRELPTKQTEERFTNMRDAIRFLRDLAKGKVPKWMRHTWTKAKLRKIPSGWAAVVDYTTGGYAGAGVGDPSQDGGGKPDDLLPMQQTDDPFGDIVYHELRELGPGEDPLDDDDGDDF